MNQRVRANSDVVDTELDQQETVLLHLQSKLYYSLNPTGTRIWQGLKRGLTLGEITHDLQEEFDISSEQAGHSVLALVDELCDQQLLSRVD
jgi:hypothetical protein